MPNKEEEKDAGTPDTTAKSAAHVDKVRISLEGCIASRTQPVFRSQRLKLPRPQRCSLNRLRSSPVPTTCSVGEKSTTPRTTPRPSAAPPPGGVGSRGGATQPTDPHPHPLHANFASTSAPFDATHTIVHTDRGYNKPRQQGGGLHQRMENAADCDTPQPDELAAEYSFALPSKKHGVVMGAGEHAFADTQRHSSPSSASRMSMHARQSPQPLVEHSALVLPAQPSEHDVSNSFESLSLPFPRFSLKAASPLQLAAPVSMLLQLAPPGVGSVPCTYTHTSTPVSKMEEGSGTPADATAVPAPSSTLAFGIGVNSQRKGLLTRKSQRRSKAQPPTSSGQHTPLAVPRKEAEEASGMRSPASEVLRGARGSGVAKHNADEDEPTDVLLLRYKRGSNSTASCGGLQRSRSVALDSLMDSLELGSHQDDVVVPVHMYLPRIKPKRTTSVALCTAVGTACKEHPQPTSDSSTRGYPHCPVYSPSPTRGPTQGPAVGSTPPPTCTVSPCSGAQCAIAIVQESEVFWNSEFQLEPAATASTSLSLTQTFAPYSSLYRIRPNLKHLSSPSLPFPALYIKNSTPSSEEKSEKKTAGIATRENSPPAAVLAPCSLPKCMPRSPASPEIPQKHLYQTVHAPTLLSKSSSSSSSKDSTTVRVRRTCMGIGRDRRLGRNSGPPSHAAARGRDIQGDSADKAEVCISTSVQPCVKQGWRVASSRPRFLSSGIHRKHAYPVPLSTQKLSASVSPEQTQFNDTKQRGGFDVMAVLAHSLKRMLCTQHEASVKENECSDGDARAM